MRDTQALMFYLLFHHNLMIILVLGNVLFISVSVIGIIFMVSFQEINILELRQHLLSLFVECLILQ